MLISTSLKALSTHHVPAWLPNGTLFLQHCCHQNHMQDYQLTILHYYTNNSNYQYIQECSPKSHTVINKCPKSHTVNCPKSHRATVFLLWRTGKDPSTKLKTIKESIKSQHNYSSHNGKNTPHHGSTRWSLSTCIIFIEPLAVYLCELLSKSVCK